MSSKYTRKHLFKVIQRNRQGGRIRRSAIERIAIKLYGIGTENYRKLMLACDESCATLRGKKRKNGEPVINHERSMFIIATVYLGITDIDLLIAIFMHDMYEDYPEDWPLERIEGLFGKVVRGLVCAVTKPERTAGMSNDEYSELVFKRVVAGGIKAITLKCIDRLHNMLTLNYDSDKIHKSAYKVKQTFEFLIPIASKYHVLAYELVIAAGHQVGELNKRGIKIFNL